MLVAQIQNQKTRVNNAKITFQTGNNTHIEREAAARRNKKSITLHIFGKMGNNSEQLLAIKFLECDRYS